MEHPESIPHPPPPSETLGESRQELGSRIHNLKQDLQNWRMKLDTQVMVYHDELSELKKSLNAEVGQLRTGFQELMTTLQQQQEDVAASFKKLGDDVGEAKQVGDGENSKILDQDPHN